VRALDAWAVQETESPHLGDGLADRDGEQVRLAGALNVLGQEVDDEILDLVEPGMPLLERVDVVLDLGHGEFAMPRVNVSRIRIGTRRTGRARDPALG
jgi:hypothetical protein